MDGIEYLWFSNFLSFAKIRLWFGMVIIYHSRCKDFGSLKHLSMIILSLSATKGAYFRLS